MCQVPGKLNRKEGNQLKLQSNHQVPIQGQRQLIFQIDSIRDSRVFQRDSTGIITVSPGFGYPNGDPSASPSDNQTKDTSSVTVINPYIGPSETPTKDTSHVPKEFSSANPINMLMEYSSGYIIGDPVSM